MKAICEGIATSFDVAVDMVYEYGYPPTVNDPEKALLAAEVAKSVLCESHVNTDTNPIFPAEDFAYMLKERLGAYSFIGQGHSAPAHHPKYDFNDEITPIGDSFLRPW